MPGIVAVVLLLLAQGAEEQYRSGLLLLKEGRVDDAARRLEAAAQQFPQFPLMWLALGEARLRQDNPAAALDAARRTRPSADRDPDVRGAWPFSTTASALPMSGNPIRPPPLGSGRKRSASTPPAPPSISISPACSWTTVRSSRRNWSSITRWDASPATPSCCACWD